MSRKGGETWGISFVILRPKLKSQSRSELLGLPVPSTNLCSNHIS
jgi:hypothetical protein